MHIPRIPHASTIHLLSFLSSQLIRHPSVVVELSRKSDRCLLMRFLLSKYSLLQRPSYYLVPSSFWQPRTQFPFQVMNIRVFSPSFFYNGPPWGGRKNELYGCLISLHFPNRVSLFYHHPIARLVLSVIIPLFFSCLLVSLSFSIMTFHHHRL